MSFTFRISNSRLITLNIPPFTSTPYQQTDNPLNKKAHFPASFFLLKSSPTGIPTLFFVLYALFFNLTAPSNSPS